MTIAASALNPQRACTSSLHEIISILAELIPVSSPVFQFLYGMSFICRYLRNIFLVGETYFFGWAGPGWGGQGREGQYTYSENSTPFLILLIFVCLFFKHIIRN